ncbi:hypothetical protein WJ07_16990 [Burkholderia vietnamiensis]|nr:hypothetical protein WI98_22535 [Burkholderia vietnamiensis]KVE90684.1 hypothetical protein WJ01_01445 [Burkholderia vietnamiensis]KVF22568.1 hypothetical protein WJ07_16990 [Burkholderia vietnamiensis]
MSAANRADDAATAHVAIQQLSASTSADTNDEHRVIADTGLQHAIAGIQQMHLNDDARRTVAKRLF